MPNPIIDTTPPPAAPPAQPKGAVTETNPEGLADCDACGNPWVGLERAPRASLDVCATCGTTRA